MNLHLKFKVQSARWWVADWLSWVAVRLRGQVWYAASYTYPEAMGNRAAELHQEVWEECVTLGVAQDAHDELAIIDEKLTELAQMAGENFAQAGRHTHWLLRKTVPERTI